VGAAGTAAPHPVRPKIVPRSGELSKKGPPINAHSRR
jgi:hypothetical protein